MRGRPPKAAEDRKQYPLNLRTTKALRDRIEAAATAAGRSMTREIEIRLILSFVQDETRGM